MFKKVVAHYAVGAVAVEGPMSSIVNIAGSVADLLNVAAELAIIVQRTTVEPAVRVVTVCFAKDCAFPLG